jgi:TonB-linked SusC/RagA family outer membrane protein
MFLCLTGQILSAQNITVKGSIKDASGSPVAGAAVVVKNAGKGVSSDENGNYTIPNVPANAVLQFSFIGMESAEVNVSGRNQIDIIMKENAISMEAVVMIGYGGTAKKKDLTGALSAIGGDKITSRANNQVITAMQGAMPGVTITRSSSAPGASGTIRVRGITSIQESDPLIIIDGVPAGSLNEVNPSDIENISVLKDASSASIYGARAAAGVVLVTTKSGVKKGFRINYGYNISFDIPTAMPEYANAVTYMKVANERNWNDNPAGGENTLYSNELIENYWTLNNENSDLYPNTDWIDLCLKNYALRNSHFFDISTGNDKSQTKFSFGYDDVSGLYKANSNWKRATIRINNTMNVVKWLKLSSNINFRNTETITPALSPAYNMRFAAPIYAGIYSDGRLAGGKDGENPYGKMMYAGNSNEKYYQLSGKFSADVTLFNDLVITGTFAPTINFDKTKTFNKQVKYYTAWNDLVSTDYLDGTNTTDLKEERMDNYTLTSQLFANYTKNINEHHFNAMVGYEGSHYFYENMWASRGEYDLPYYPYLAAGPETLKDNNGDAYENAYNSFFGRLMYNWKSRYYIQTNFRYDGSSRFAADYRWGFFPSVSGAWVMSQEKFMKNIDWISMLKIRLSWGQLGNERIGNYPYQSSIAFNTGTLYQGSVVVPSQGASAYIYAIPDITWETTETTDLGLDLSLFGDKLRFTGDWYYKQTKDMLLPLQIPTYMGYSNPDQNAGVMTTKGWDIDLSWKDNIGKLNYTVAVNLSDYKTVMGNMAGTQVLSDNLMIKEGSEYKEWYGYVSDGIYQTVEQVNTLPKMSTAVTVGDIIYKDISGPEGIPDGKIDATYDRVLLGGSLPRYNYGGSINLEYKNFDFGVVFQGVGKRKSMLTSEMVLPIRGDWYNVPQIIVGNYWSKYNTEEQNLAATYPRVSRTGEANNYVASDFWLINGAYFRIKNISLGYTLPALKGIINGNNTIRIYATLQDFFTFSHFPKGWDPEVSSTGYPITKSVIFGASINF